MDQITKAQSAKGDKMAQSLEQIKADILAGNYTLEEMKELKNLFKPESENAKKRREAQAALDTYLDLSLIELLEMNVGTAREVFENIKELQAAFPKGKGGGAKKSIHRYTWIEPKTDFKIELHDGTELNVHPSSNAWKNVMLEKEYTLGQVQAVIKTRPYRKYKGGEISLEELNELI